MSVTIDYSKLRILPDPDTREWWEAARQHKYLVRRCSRCGHKWFPPNIPACSKCASMEIGWVETAGKGVLHSYVAVVQPIIGAFISAVPYVVCIIELDDFKETDGAVTRIAGVLTNDEQYVAIGLPCQVLYEETA